MTGWLLDLHLPAHHADPFDRMIIAQAMVEQTTVLTAERDFEKYPIDVIWCVP
jgi:PIN domain nuclease of toxin-antitoxin system